MNSRTAYQQACEAMRQARREIVEEDGGVTIFDPVTQSKMQHGHGGSQSVKSARRGLVAIRAAELLGLMDGSSESWMRVIQLALLTYGEPETKLRTILDDDENRTIAKLQREVELLKAGKQ